MTLTEIQSAVKQWTRKNFGPPVPPYHRPVLGMMEELGELADAYQADTEEEWRSVVGYDPYFTTHYEVSNRGRVRRTAGGKGTYPNRLLKPHTHKQGYIEFCLSRGTQSSSQHIYAHLLVAAAFIGNRPEGYEVNHRNGIKKDNDVSNLEYVTHQENLEHAFRLGLLGQKRRTREATQTAFSNLVAAAGRLAHARLKKEQGIRGTPEEHDAKAKDAVGDLVIYLLDFCNCMEWDLQQVIEETWTGVVAKRDWNQHPIDGVEQ